jgi:hypothetical protein
MREPLHNDARPTRVDRRLTDLDHRLRRWRTAALASLAVLIVAVGWLARIADPDGQVAEASPAAVVQALDDPNTQHQTEQIKAENALLRSALQAADKVVGHHRHHSQKMWDMLAGRISAQEAWWQGGSATCEGWVDAGQYEVAVGKLKGKEVTPPPVPAEGLKFCKQARERR